MKTIHAFDFDGTITNRDTLIEFIRYTSGNRFFITGFLRHLPMLVMIKLGLYPSGKAKQRIFNYFFGKFPSFIFDDLCFEFARDNRHLLRPCAIAAINDALAKEDTQVVIISASIDAWVSYFFADTEHTKPEGSVYPGTTNIPVHVIGTKLEIENEGGYRLSGRFSTPNCKGKEKVRRLLELFPDRESYHLIAYGDSRGDRELMDFADEAHYKPFRK